jgi:hypothetical protein
MHHYANEKVCFTMHAESMISSHLFEFSKLFTLPPIWVIISVFQNVICTF